MEISVTAPTLWPRLHSGAAHHSTLEVPGRPSLPLKQQQEVLFVQHHQQQQQRQQQLQAPRHSSLLAMQQLLRETATVVPADSGILPHPSGVLAMGRQAAPARIMSPITETPPLFHQGGDAERGCSISRTSSSSRSSSLLPIIVESSSEAFSDSEEEAEGWTEVTLEGLEGGDRERQRLPPAIPLEQQPPTPLSNAPANRDANRRDTRDKTSGDEHLHRNHRGSFDVSARTALPQQQKYVFAQQQQKRGFSFLRGLARAFRSNRREALGASASNTQARPRSRDTSADPEAARAATQGIVALHMELLQLSREARRRRRLRCKTNGNADAAAQLSSSTISSDSSTTSRTGSRCSSSLRTRPRRRRFSCSGFSRSRCTFIAKVQRQRSFSAPAHTTGQSHWLSGDRSQGQLEDGEGGRGQDATRPPWRRCSRGGFHTRSTQDFAAAQDEDARTPGPAVAPRGSAGTFDLTMGACQCPAKLDGEVEKAAEAAAASLRERGRRRRELRAREAASVLKREKERQELQRSVLWWFASDILMPQL